MLNAVMTHRKVDALARRQGHQSRSERACLIVDILSRFCEPAAQCTISGAVGAIWYRVTPTLERCYGRLKMAAPENVAIFLPAVALHRTRPVTLGKHGQRRGMNAHEQAAIP